LVIEGKLRTGSVFRGIVDNITAEPALKVFMLENVRGITFCPQGGGPSPLDWVVHSLTSEAMQYVFAMLLDPTEFGFETSRPRIWMVGLPLAELEGIMTIDEADLLMQGYLDECSRAACKATVPLTALILDESHRMLCRTRAECEGLPIVLSAPLAPAKPGAKGWIDTHWDWAEGKSDKDNSANASNSGCAPWESGIPDVAAQHLFPSLRMLFPREYDMLRHKFHVVAFPELVRRLINVSPSIDWATGIRNHARLHTVGMSVMHIVVGYAYRLTAP
jgi:hypothetical protein